MSSSIFNRSNPLVPQECEVNISVQPGDSSDTTAINISGTEHALGRAVAQIELQFHAFAEAGRQVRGLCRLRLPHSIDSIDWNLEHQIPERQSRSYSSSITVAERHIWTTDLVPLDAKSCGACCSDFAFIGSHLEVVVVDANWPGRKESERRS